VQRPIPAAILLGARPGAGFGRSHSGVLDGAASFLSKAGTLANSASHRVTSSAGSASKQVLVTAAAAGRKVKAAINQARSHPAPRIVQCSPSAIHHNCAVCGLPIWSATTVACAAAGRTQRAPLSTKGLT